METIPDEYVVRIHGEGITVDDLKKESGSLEEYRDFVAKACNCSVDVLEIRTKTDIGGKDMRC